MDAAYIFVPVCFEYIRMRAELFGNFHLFTLFLEDIDYTARVQHALVAVEWK